MAGGLDVPTREEIPLATQQIGNGPDRVVFLHGFLGQGKNLSTLARKLCERHPTWYAVLVDLLGHGLSPALPPDADLETLADGVVPIVGEGATIVGHSLGGRVGLVVAGRVPERVRKLTMLDITPGPVSLEDSATQKLMAAMVSGPVEAKSREAFRDHLLGQGVARHLVDWQMLNVEHDETGARWRGHFDPRLLASMLPRNNHRDLWPIVERRQVPIHQVRGDRSPYVSDSDVERLRANGARVDTLEGVGHFVHTEGLARLLELMDATDSPSP
jgi:esterase